MFGKIKNYAVKKMMEQQLKNVPEDQRQMLMEMVEKDPKLFEQMAKEMQEEMKQNGNNQQAAAMKIMPKYQAQLMAVMSPEMKEKITQMQGGGGGQFNPDGSIRK